MHATTRSTTAPAVTHNSHAANHAATTHVGPSGRDPHEELLTIRVDGVTDHAQLVQIAKSLYEEIGRNEIDGTVESKHTTSFSNTDANIANVLKLRPGRTVELVVDSTRFSGATYNGNGTNRPTIEATLSQTVSLPIEQAIARVREYIRDEQLARVIVATYRGQIMGMLRYFRVANARFDWTASQTEAGITTNIDFQNYFLPRLDITRAPRATGAAVGHGQRHNHARVATQPHNPGPNDPGGINNPIPMQQAGGGVNNDSMSQGDTGYISDAVARQRRRQEGG